ncbi:MAG: flagellar hook-length control protein FliK [Pirellulales bacterium]|nr:flagellar hook-length control protein FliK [Pirellulales bacterium]
MNPLAGVPLLETAFRELCTNEGLARHQELFNLFLQRAQLPKDAGIPPSKAASFKEPSRTTSDKHDASTGGSFLQRDAEDRSSDPAGTKTTSADATRKPHSPKKPREEDRDTESPVSSETATPAQAATPADAPAGAPSESASDEMAPAPAESARTENVASPLTGQPEEDRFPQSAEYDGKMDASARITASPSEESVPKAVQEAALQTDAADAQGKNPPKGLNSEASKTAEAPLRSPLAAEADETRPSDAENSGEDTDRRVASSVRPKNAVAAVAALSNQPVKTAAVTAENSLPATTILPAELNASMLQAGSAPKAGVASEATTALGTQTAGLQRQGAATASQIAGKGRASLDGEANPTLDRVRFVQRVAQAFAAAGNHGGSVRLKLNPPELGALRLEITVRKGEMKARLEAETPAAKHLLLENLSLLRERLAEQDIRIQRFDVEVMDQRPGGSSEQTAPHGNSGGSQDGYRPPGTRAAENVPDSVTAAGAPRWLGDEGQLNVLV